jgi:hypothetical protein
MERCVCVGINNNFGAFRGEGAGPMRSSSITGPRRVRPQVRTKKTAQNN